jgi:lysozyme family protein
MLNSFYGLINQIHMLENIINDNFMKSVKYVLQSEGGYVNNPKDPGGPTNLGVTKASWTSFLKKPVNDNDIKKLTVDDVIPFYKKRYWDICLCDNLPLGIDYCVFDYAINSGPIRAVETLRRLIGLEHVGAFEKKNIESYFKENKDNIILIKKICSQRLLFLQSLKNYEVFGKGWLNRVLMVQEKSLGMASKSEKGNV